MMSGCQSFRLCILAARRVLPPDFTTAAIWDELLFLADFAGNLYAFRQGDDLRD